MVDLKKLAEDCAAILDREHPNASLSVEVTVWAHPRSGRPREPRVIVSIWDGHQHFEGHTPTEAFLLFSVHHTYSPPHMPPTPLSEVAEVVVPDTEDAHA